MRVLMLSTDRKIFQEGSDVRARHIAYGECFDELNIFVGSLKGNTHSTEILSPKVKAYPINFASSALWSPEIRPIVSLITRSDVVVVQDPVESGMPGMGMALLSHAPLYVQVHTDLFSPAYRKFSGRNAWHAQLAGFTLRNAKRIRVVSDKVKRDIEEKYGTRIPISVLPIFVDIAKWNTLQKTKHPRFGLSALIVGRLEKEKNIDVAITAVHDAREAGHDIGLTIVGDGSEKERLKELVTRFGIGEYVDFIGHQHDLSSFYASADVVLVTSEYEGYGMVIVEALAAHIPVLATDVGVARESGALIAEKRLFSGALLEWIQSGSRVGTLQQYPYASFQEYRDAFCADIKATVASK
jgi:glycosyltransferase involved in cell wall biosynthesis